MGTEGRRLVADDGRFELIGDIRSTVDGASVLSDVTATIDRWSGVAIAAWADDAHESLDPSSFEDRLREAERLDEASMSRVLLPHHHRSRATDALRVLHALTDPITGAPVASATTSLPEAAGGDRQFDYRFSWLRDSGLAVTTAALLGHLDAAEATSHSSPDSSTVTTST